MESTNYFRRLTLRQIAARIFEVFAKGDNTAVFLSLSAIVLVPFIAIMATTFFFVAALVTALVASNSTDEGSAFPDRPSPIDVKYLLVLIGFETILYVTITVIGRGGMIRAVAETYLGSQPEWSACFHRGKRRFWALFCSGWFIFLAALVGALVPGLFAGLAVVFKSAGLTVVTFLVQLAYLAGCFYALVCMILVFPAIVVENKSAVGGIKRSFELVSGRWCYVFCTNFLFVLAENILSTILRRVILGSDPLAAFSVLGVVVRFAPSIFFLPMFTILYTVLYFNLRIEIEGLNAEVLSRDLGTEPTEGVYTGLPLMTYEESVV